VPPATPGEDPFATLASPKARESVAERATVDYPAKPDSSGWPEVPGYEILAELGHGGMGVVYKARHLKLNRLVALKMVLAGAQAGPEDLLRFLAEAESIAQVQHPNIVQVHEIGQHGRVPYFAMEYVAGGSLAHRVKGEPLEAGQATRMVEMLARGVQAAHQRGIIHRDLKPANVLLQIEDSPGSASTPAEPSAICNLQSAIPKITDFGLAKRLEADSGLTRTGQLMGTPSYMPPEQARGEIHKLGPACDIYALGAILYELLAGRPPFRGTSVTETLDQVVNQEVVWPSRLRPKLPRDLETICLKCLEKERGKRYPSAEDLGNDLKRFLAHEPILARPVGTLERVRKWARRKPAKAGLVGVTILLAVAALAFVGLYALYAAQRLTRIGEQQTVLAGASESLLREQKCEAAGDWNGAFTELAGAREALKAQPELHSDELRAEIERRLAVVEGKLKEQEKGKQAIERAAKFQKAYSDALFFETVFTGLEQRESRDKARAAARAALDIYGLGDLPVGSPGLGSERVAHTLELDQRYHVDTEQRKLAGSCYELLLIWADIETAAPAGKVGDGAEERRGAENALALLARAALLGQAYGLDTRTYHLRKARYLAQSQGKAFSPATVRGAPKEPTGRLDWFLTGLESYREALSTSRPEKKFVASLAACKRAIEYQNDDLWAHYIAALNLLRLGRWLDAKAELTICLNLKQKGFVWPRLLRGFAASEHGNNQTDQKLAESEFQGAQDDFDLALKEDESKLVQHVGLANRGVLNIRRRLWTDAVRDLERSVTLNQKGFQAYLNLAQALEGLGRWHEAARAMDQAVSLAPAPQLYRSRAKLRCAQVRGCVTVLVMGGFPDALTNAAVFDQVYRQIRDDYRTAIALEPPDSKSEQLSTNLLELGQLLQQDGDHRAAMALYERGIEVKPEAVVFQHLRAETLLALGLRREAGEALDTYLAHAKTPTHEVYLARGVIYAEMGKLPKAIEMYTLALTKEPKHTKTRCQRGWAYLFNDAVRPALEDFEICLKEDSANVDAVIGAGNARIRLRELDAALALAGQAEKKQSRLTDRMLYNLARIYAQAAGQLQIEARTFRYPIDRTAAENRSECQRKALNHLRQATDKLRPERRAGFWQTQIPADPALAAIRETFEFRQLAARYAASAVKKE
jgi:tRNA A-37 threonylcarbamoyl transferase component Bud32